MKTFEKWFEWAAKSEDYFDDGLCKRAWDYRQDEIDSLKKERDHYKEKFEAEKKRTDNLFDKLETKITQSNPCVNLNC